MSEKIHCHICKTETEYNCHHFTTYHLKRFHDLDPKVYFDTYLKKDGEGICKSPSCTNETKFRGLGRGYRDYCSNKCTQSDPKHLEIKRQNSLKKHGFEHPHQNPNLKKKIKQDNLKRIGVESIFETEEFKSKRKESLKNRFGVEEYFDSEEFKEFFEKNKDDMSRKAKESLMKNYGVDNASKSKVILERRSNNNKEKYGVGNVFQLEEVKDKRKETLINKHGDNYQSILTKKIWDELSSEQKEARIAIQIEWKKEKFLEFLKPKFEIGYKLIDYNVKGRHKLFCPLDHEFEIQGQLLFDRVREFGCELCTVCNPLIKPYSKAEKELVDFIKHYYHFEIIENSKTILGNGQELDIYLPELNLAFEFNGLYWHSSQVKEYDYHLSKTELCESKGIHLIHIYEDDWSLKRTIVESRILNILGKTPNKIMARKCKIEEVSNEDSREFLKQNHIQGPINCAIKIGLYYKGELVSLMTFSKKGLSKKGGDQLELKRFCNKLNTNVIGAASRLFNYFDNTYGFKEIISYADRSWSQGNLYKQLNFEFIGKTVPNYHYIVNGVRESRMRYQKKRLIEQGFDESKTEFEIMNERGHFRIYDSGSLIYKYSK